MLGKESITRERKSNKRRGNEKKVKKGVRGMPRLSEAKKDVISCEKPRGGANNHRSVDFRMGEPIRQLTDIRCKAKANPGN
jgi:hypothetical protein